MYNILLTGAATLAFALLSALASAQSEDAGLRHVGRHIPGLAADDIVRAKALEPVDDDFRGHLAREYHQLVIFETDEMHDWRDADYYAEKVMALGDNKMVSPELVEDWEIEDPADAESLATARDRLIAAFDDGASYCSSHHVVDRSRKFCWRSSGDGHRERRRSTWRRISSRSMSACRMIQGAPLQCCSAGSVPSAMRRRMVD